MAVRMNVRDIDLELLQFAGYKERAVARQGFSLGTQKGNSVRLGTRHHTFQSASKKLCSGQQSVLHLAALVARWILGPRAQFVTEEHVCDSGFLKRMTQRLAVELRMEPAVRK